MGYSRLSKFCQLFLTRLHCRLVRARARRGRLPPSMAGSSDCRPIRTTPTPATADTLGGTFGRPHGPPLFLASQVAMLAIKERGAHLKRIDVCFLGRTKHGAQRMRWAGNHECDTCVARAFTNVRPGLECSRDCEAQWFHWAWAERDSPAQWDAYVKRDWPRRQIIGFVRAVDAQQTTLVGTVNSR